VAPGEGEDSGLTEGDGSGLTDGDGSGLPEGDGDGAAEGDAAGNPGFSGVGLGSGASLHQGVEAHRKSVITRVNRINPVSVLCLITLPPFL